MYDVTALRARIPALRSGTAFFDGPGGTQTPADVAGAIAAALTAPLSNLHAPTDASRNAEAIVTGARAAMADLLGAEPNGIVFGRSMTQLAYDVARTLSTGWSPEDEIVVSRLDHDAHVRPWTHAAQQAGATVRVADFDPATGELTAAHVSAVLSERTRVIAVTGASNLLGTRPPLSEIAALAQEVGALLSVDAVHLAAHAPIDLPTLHADLLFCSPYKFMGPHLGVLAADPALLATLHPAKLDASPDEIPERFELGTLPYELLAGVSAAVEVIASLGHAAPGAPDRRTRLRVAMHAVEVHEQALLAQCEQGLATLPGITQYARAAHRTPTLLLGFADHDPQHISLQLAARGVNAPAGSFYALQASRRLGLGDAGGLRIGLAPYTDADDIQRLLDGLAATLTARP